MALKKRAVLAITALVFFLIPARAAQDMAREKAGKSAPIEEMLIAKEREVWEAFRKKDASALNRLLSDDSYEITASGVSTKADQIKTLDEFTIKDFTIEEAKVTMLNSGAAIVRYRLSLTAVSKDGEPKTEVSYSSAVWAIPKGKWQNVSYQETPFSLPK
ncbi:MAG TPA: nuclear transport factor 2 family protein [Blastocatellia bacterium]|jgi:hypothetical protein|nr:nuclear transport factor 2 family protein [Blastocatellia bacterium]